MDIAGKLETAIGYEVVLVDCLTLWVNNLMYAAHLGKTQLDEDVLSEKSRTLVKAAKTPSGRVLFVTNEVGLGIVPENKDARQYRDLVGRCNQQIASAADNVYLVSCGIPMKLKEE